MSGTGEISTENGLTAADLALLSIPLPISEIPPSSGLRLEWETEDAALADLTGLHRYWTRIGWQFAFALQASTEQYGRGDFLDKLAASLGYANSKRFRNILAVMELSSTVDLAIAADLPLSYAETLAGIKDPDEVARYIDEVTSMGLSVKGLRERIEADRNPASYEAEGDVVNSPLDGEVFVTVRFPADDVQRAAELLVDRLLVYYDFEEVMAALSGRLASLDNSMK